MSTQRWYHVTFSAYGQWLPGDPRGWRERDHRRHVPGSHTNPPAPSNWAKGLLEHSKEILKDDPIVFDAAQREKVGEFAMEAFKFYKCAMVVIAAGGIHVHTLVELDGDSPKIVVGKVKSWVDKQLKTKNHLLAEQTGRRLWAEGNHPKPIKSEEHSIETYKYICDHVSEGAWVWKDEDAFKALLQYRK